MRPLLYATGNTDKFRQAQLVCSQAGIELIQDSLEVPEIQGEDPEVIARDKAQKAFAKFQKPVIVSDDSWQVHGLRGFPGPYMKSVSKWFSVDDWLNLTRPLTNKQASVRQIVVYQDQAGQQLFSLELPAVLIDEARGSSHNAFDCITSFDNGAHTVAEVNSQGRSALGHLPSVWHDFAEWYST